MNNPSNADLYSVLLDIKEDIGGLKNASELQLQGLKNHAERIGVLEGVAARQKGAAKVWGLVATGAGALVGAAPTLYKMLLKH